MRLWLCTMLLVSLGALAWPAGAAPGPHSEPDEGWEFSLTPYAWVPGIRGELGSSDGTTVDLEISPLTDLLSVNYGAFFAGEARHGRWLIATDSMLFNATYEGLSDVETLRFPGGSVSESFSGKVTKTVDIGGAERTLGPASVAGTFNVDIPGFDVSVGPIDVETNVQMVIAQLTGGYRLLDRPVASLFGGTVADGDERRLTFDLFGGARYMNVKGWSFISIPPIQRPSFDVSASGSVSVAGGGNQIGSLPITTPQVRTTRSVDFGDVEIPAGTPLVTNTLRVKVAEWWVDPIVGLRLRGDFRQNWYWVVSGDVGGFGIGSASKLTWQALTGIGWRFGEHWSSELSLRALEVDRETADTTIRMLLWGPQIALTYRF